jgi:hypothetical protein
LEQTAFALRLEEIKGCQGLRVHACAKLGLAWQGMTVTKIEKT